TTGCPLTPEPWSRWSFHQYTDSGRVAGIRGNVDMNYFAGTEADLDALTFQGGGSTPPPEPPPPPMPSDCAAFSASGGTIEEDGACVELGGPANYLRAESSGSDGGHVWTGATDASNVENFARWTLRFSQPGRYRVMAHVQGTSRSTREAKYRVAHAGGRDEVFADQSSARGFFELGTFDFAADDYEVFLPDNTGEADSLDRRVVFDAVRVVAPTSEPCTTITLARGYSSLNVRPRPNTNRTALMQLTSGQRATRLATVPGAAVNGTTAWQRVRIGSTVGYVSGYYTSCVN
ncbi:hypothetical protein L6R52_02100, partial [Myxococcota bacterium]|nr:hypothetical protein [Myxococcota bacterium]